MSGNSLTLVLLKTQIKNIWHMTKVNIKSEKLTPFGGIFSGRGAIWLHIVFCNRLTPRFIETEKYDAKPLYKKFLGYRPGVAVIGDLIVGIENSDDNTKVRFHQKDTLKRFFERFEQNYYQSFQSWLWIMFRGNRRRSRGTLQILL